MVLRHAFDRPGACSLFLRETKKNSLPPTLTREYCSIIQLPHAHSSSLTLNPEDSTDPGCTWPLADIQRTQMEVADWDSWDGGEYHGPATAGSSSLLTIKGSSNPSIVPFELWLTDKSYFWLVRISRSRYSVTLWAMGLICELIRYYLRQIKVLHTSDLGRKKNLPHRLCFPNHYKLQGKKVRCRVHLKIPRGTQSVNQMLG